MTGGYQRKRKLYTLSWGEDHELHGLVVVTRGLSVEKLVGLARMVAEVTGMRPAFDGGEVSRAQIDQVLDVTKQMFRIFAGKLVSWNLEDDEGEPVPATYEAIEALDDLPLMKDLILTWMEAVASVDTPLPASSNGSPQQAPEASLPMEPLPVSPSS